MTENIDDLRGELEHMRNQIAELRASFERRHKTAFSARFVGTVVVLTIAGALCALAVTKPGTPLVAAPTRVSAPFSVVNDAGETIFLVYQKPTGPSVEVQVSGKPLLQMGMWEKANPAFRVFTPTGERAAAMGRGPEGFGGLQLFGGAPEPLAWMYGGGPRGAIVAVSGGNNVAHAALAIGQKGGLLQLADTSGMVTAEGGVLPSGSGVFRVRGKKFQYISGDGLRLPAW